jgi:hypothetical protein
LPIGDEFRERTGFRVTHEKFRKCLAQPVCNDELRWRDAGTNGSEPRPERVPNELGRSDGEILEQSLSDNASLNEDMISVDFSFDMASVIGRFAMKVLIAVAARVPEKEREDRATRGKLLFSELFSESIVNRN